ncbi:hypothetical protein BJV85_003609 [Clostridium acetobutylicum]|uniref:Ubiquitin-like domain-containing protein n=1 Tax=Clostridium acetobutylicum (strain ATCC 824 / DSM 792 / JCM 1419 / IAM 19013 / LMG 5710 / NBRC 13948 / NRRL B-527 / VKM B-1787 / 2291 / W) TaxID=272562 RepID=Q97LZ1_CLOAB|nr:MULTISPECIES: hypothetical protein [Clostridium]AAK78389.1 Hypothetical protein CA_C0409 [Clostridium acetobutylicum ATCC 824]ADZ19458.1 Conserved hypothetical protein [Clostridium acetobutylicum EA 2018]AEI31225.1 hypothetical protein SMB_G0417 [Clostridium acetobutylicum DSM 1731]AWV80112.1 hypothetical protein DK921_08400 [Clostridium acetobutylicum]KHD37816.1 hypothetical protein NL50_06450 [Clostridium acetobutylicum]
MNKVNNIIVTVRIKDKNRQADFDLPLDESLENVMNIVYPSLLQVNSVEEEMLKNKQFYINGKGLDKASTLRDNAIWDGSILEIY